MNVEVIPMDLERLRALIRLFEVINKMSDPGAKAVAEMAAAQALQAFVHPPHLVKTT